MSPPADDPRPLYCRGCRGILGLMVGAALLIGAVKFRQLVTLECCCCGRRKVWRPDPGRPPDAEERAA